MVKLVELKQRAKDLGIKGVSTMRKAQLEELLKSKEKTIKVKKKKPEGGSKAETVKVKRKRCPKGTRKEKETGKCLKKPSADVIDLAYAEPVRRRIGKEMDNLIAGDVVKQMLLARIGDRISNDDLTDPQILAMTILKLNVFTLNKWLELEENVAYASHEESIANIAGDMTDEVFIDEEFDLDDPDKVLESVYLSLDQVDYSDELENYVDSYDFHYGYDYDYDDFVARILSYFYFQAIETTDDLKVIIDVEYDMEDNEDYDQVEDVYNATIKNGQKKVREVRDYLVAALRSIDSSIRRQEDEGLDTDDDEDEDDREERETEEINTKTKEKMADIIFSVGGGVGDILDGGRGDRFEFIYKAEIVRQMGVSEQEELLGSVYAITNEGRFEDTVYVKASYEQLKDSFAAFIEMETNWTNPYNPMGILADLTYGYVDIEYGNDYDDDERFVDYYGFSYTEEELIDEEMYTIGSISRRNQIMEEVQITPTQRDDFNRILAISEGRRGKSP